MKVVQKFLTFLRLVDAHDGTLSMTSIALYVGLTKLATAAQVGPTEVAVLLLALLNYSGKKLINQRASKAGDVVDLAAQVESLKTKVAAIGAFKSPLR